MLEAAPLAAPKMRRGTRICAWACPSPEVLSAAPHPAGESQGQGHRRQCVWLPLHPSGGPTVRGRARFWARLLLPPSMGVPGTLPACVSSAQPCCRREASGSPHNPWDWNPGKQLLERSFAAAPPPPPRSCLKLLQTWLTCLRTLKVNNSTRDQQAVSEERPMERLPKNNSFPPSKNTTYTATEINILEDTGKLSQFPLSSKTPYKANSSHG